MLPEKRVALKHIAENLWTAEEPFRLLGAEMGTRMTIMRLENDALLLHSPIRFSNSLKAELNQLGQVSTIMTPNAFHGKFTQEWCSAYSNAQYFPAKKTSKYTTRFTRLLSDLASDAFAPDIEMHHVQGVPLAKESIFLHRPSRTLVLTDMAFHIGTDIDWRTRVFCKLNGAYNRFGPSRMMRSFIRNREQFRSSLLTILEWDFDRMIMSHGNIIQSNAST